jgi:hypothetical protein
MMRRQSATSLPISRVTSSARKNHAAETQEQVCGEVDHILLLLRVEGLSGLKGTQLSARSLASAVAMWRSISDDSQIWMKNWLFSSLDRLGLTEGR